MHSLVMSPSLRNLIVMSLVVLTYKRLVFR